MYCFHRVKTNLQRFFFYFFFKRKKVGFELFGLKCGTFHVLLFSKTW